MIYTVQMNSGYSELYRCLPSFFGDVAFLDQRYASE